MLATQHIVCFTEDLPISHSSYSSISVDYLSVVTQAEFTMVKTRTKCDNFGTHGKKLGGLWASTTAHYVCSYVSSETAENKKQLTK